MATDIDSLFYKLGRTQKVKFIDDHIDLASSYAIAKYVKSYLFDVLEEVNQKMIVSYLREKGYQVELIEGGGEK